MQLVHFLFVMFVRAKNVTAYETTERSLAWLYLKELKTCFFPNSLTGIKQEISTLSQPD